MQRFRFLLAMGLFPVLAPAPQAQALLETRLSEARDYYGEGALAADKAGNVYVATTAAGFDDKRIKNKTYLSGLIRYNPQGQKLWTRMWGEEDEYCTIKGAAADLQGNVYVVGRMIGHAIAKFDSSGNEKWNLHGKKVGHDKKDESEYHAVAVDRAGNVFAAGYSARDLNDSEYVGQGILLVKYAGDGRPLWKRRFDQSGSGARGVAVDAQGNLYLVGSCAKDWDGQKNRGGPDFFLMKCNSEGRKIWVRQYGGPRSDWGSYVAVDPAGNVLAVVNMELDSTQGGGYSLNIFKHDKDGKLLYRKNTGYPGYNDHGFVHTGDGGLYGMVFTTVEPPAPRNNNLGKYQQYLVKYGPDGEKAWAFPFGNENLRAGAAMAVDAQGFIYSLGSRSDPRTQVSDICLAKFAPGAPSPGRK